MRASFRLKNGPGRFAGGAQKGLLTIASSRTWRVSGVSAAPVPPGHGVKDTPGMINCQLSEK